MTDSPLLQIKNLSVAFRQGSQQREVATDVSLDYSCR